MNQIRECVCCKSSALAYSLDGPSIVALNVTIYRRSPKRGLRGRRQQLATAKGVRVCESCLQAMIAADGKLGVKAETLAVEIIRTIGNRYSTMLKDEAA